MVGLDSFGQLRYALTFVLRGFEAVLPFLVWSHRSDPHRCESLLQRRDVLADLGWHTICPESMEAHLHESLIDRYLELLIPVLPGGT